MPWRNMSACAGNDPMTLLRPALAADAAFLAESLIAVSLSVRERPGSPYNRLLPERVTPKEFEYALGFVERAEGSPARLALVAQEGGERVGCLLAEVTDSSVPALVPGKAGTIAACWVAPAFRRRGIAGKMVAAAEDWFRERGVRFAELSYGADSETAEAAWSALGYAPFRALAAKDLTRAGNPPEKTES